MSPLDQRGPIYPSDSVPAPKDHIPGETEFERAIRLEVESQRRFEAAVARFAPVGERVPCAVPVAAPPARFHDLGKWRD